MEAKGHMFGYRMDSAGSHDGAPYPLGAPAPAAGTGWQLGLPLAVACIMGGFVVFAEGQALAACAALLACVFILLDFRVGVVLLIVLMPLSASTLFPHSMAGITGLNPLNILLMATLGSYLMRDLPKGGLKRFAPRPLVWFYVVPIVLAGLLGSRHAGEIPFAFNVENLIAFNGAGGYLRDLLLKPMFLVLFALLVGAAVSRSKQPERFLLPLLVAIWAMGLMTLVHVYLSGATLGELASSRARGLLSPLGLHANDLGRLYAVAYALLLFTAAECRDHRLTAALVATMGLVVVVLTLTFSRGAFFGFAVVNIWFLLSRRRVSSLLVVGALFAAAVAFLPGVVLERIGTGWGEGLNAMSAGRIDEIWLPLLPELWHSPVWGNGLGAILWSHATRTGTALLVDHPHNAYFRAALDMGFVGLALLCAYFIHVWRGFRRLGADPALNPVQRGFFAGAAVGLFSFLLAAIVGSSLTPATEQVFLWLAIGMMYGLRPAEPNDAEHTTLRPASRS